MHAPDWAGEPVDTGREALAQAEIMREHTLSNTGGSQPHSNLQPYLVLNFVVALVGIYPSQN